MRNYSGYMDHATKDTLANFEVQRSPIASGSGSDDFAGLHGRSLWSTAMRMILDTLFHT